MRLIHSLLALCLLFLHGLGAEEPSECFDQQYTNNVANFRALHIVQRIAVIAPLSAYHIYTEITDGSEQLVRRENGESLVAYSSISSANIDWQNLNVLARSIRVSPVFEDKEGVSPVIIVTACPYHTRAVYLDAQPFSVDAYRVGLVSMYENELSVIFRTFEDGIFFFSMADQGDMLVAQLVHGRVQCIFDFGSLSRWVSGILFLCAISSASITGGRALNDGEWHEFRWTHQFDSVQLFVDGVMVNSTVPSGLYRKLDFNFQVEIGGRPEDQYSNEIETSFHGCLAKVILNNVDLLSMAPKTARDCQMPRPQILSIKSGSVQIPYSFLPFALEFRILANPSRLLSILDSMNVTLLDLKVDDNRRLVLEADSKQVKQLSLPDVEVTDGSWHALSVKLRGGRLDVDVDGYTVLWLEGTLVRKIGLKMTSFRISAQGCFRSATVDLKSATTVVGEVLRDLCVYQDKCLPNPCENEGRCLQVDLDKFKCDCAKHYTGTYCHTSLLPRSCEDHYYRKGVQSSSSSFPFKIRSHSFTTSTANISIDLDGGGPLKPLHVICSNFGQPNGTESTVLEHNVGQGIYVTGPTEPGAVRRALDYGVDGEELDRLIDGFDSCKQFMRFECQGGAKLMSYGQERRPSTWYATRNGQHGLQWADAPPFSRMCSCALNSTCNYNKMCNCDTGRDGVDDGYNAHSQLLPIMQLYVGGTQQTSSVNISIGPLRCQRRLVYEVVTFIDRNQNVVGTQSFGLATVFDIYIQIRFSHEQMTIFTWESPNGERWYQLFVREGRIVGQIVNAGRSHEIVSDVQVNDNAWHIVYWEVDPQTSKLVVDRHEKSITSFFILPDTFTYILGSRTGRGNSGFAGQVRGLYLCGKEIHVGHLVRKLNPLGIQIGDTGYCRMNRCANDAKCVEYYDSYRCNCSSTPFNGDKCDQEVGMWIPHGSELSIPWQHPATMATCYRINVQTKSTNVSLITAKALFAESRFNLSIDHQGNLNVQIFDGFFYSKNVTNPAANLADDKTKDISFCANRHNFTLNVNGEQMAKLDGNFTFFINFNQWKFVDKNFTGCISRLQIGNGFPLKNPSGSRLTFTGRVKFGSCPYNPLQYQPAEELEEKPSEIQITSIVQTQQRLLFITPAIGIATAIALAIILCVIVCYIRSRPDGVYKTNENVVPYSSKSAEPLVHEHPYSKEYFC